jgi:hypothetical protein
MVLFRMTQNAQGSDVGRIEHPASVYLDWDAMMRVENATFGVVTGREVAFGASEVVALKDRKTEQGVSLIPALASRFDAELGSECAEVEILGEPIGVHGRVEVPVILSSPAECADGRMSFGSAKSRIPGKGILSKLNLAAVGVMTAFVFGNAQAAATVFVDREGKESLLATAFAFDLNPVDLCLRNSHSNLLESRGSSLPHAGKLENSENCWNPLRADAATAWSAKTSANAENVSDWAISSRAAEESVEGSTTRAWSPERTVKPHDYATGNGRYSLVCNESCRSIGLNADAITIRPYSGKLEALAKFSVRKPVMQALRNDAVKTYDRAAWAQFDQCKLRAFPTSGTSTNAITLTTNGTMTGTNTVALGVGHIKAIVDTMKERNIPGYVGDDYMAVAWPTTYRTVKNSLETLHQYTAAGIQLVFNAEIGRYENVRFTEQTNVVKGRSTDGITGTAWTTALSDWCFFFGEDTVAEGIAIPEEIRAKIPTDYGRSKGVAYYSINGFGLVHNQTDATEARVLKWDSAA